jgi:3-methyladenine DNA glycosylase Mpg
VSLARYLIGKILVREMAEGVASGRIVETRRMSSATPRGTPTAG